MHGSAFCPTCSSDFRSYRAPLSDFQTQNGIWFAAFVIFFPTSDVISGMEAERAAHRCRGALVIRELRGAVFSAIARTLIRRLDQKAQR